MRFNIAIFVEPIWNLVYDVCVLTDGLPSRVERFLYRHFQAGTSFVLQVAEIRRQYPGKPLVFTLYAAGVVEFWVLRYFLVSAFGKEFAPRYATRIWGLFSEPFRLNLRRVASLVGLAKPVSRIRLCSEDLKQGRSIILNFEATDRRKAFETPMGEKELSYLQRNHSELFVIPVVFVWQRKRVIEKDVPENFSERVWKTLVFPLISLWNLTLGDPYQPNFNRKMALLMLGYRHTTLRAGSLQILDDSQSPKVARRRILIDIQQEKKVILGPSFRSTRFLAEGIFRDPTFHKMVGAISADTGSSELSLLKKSSRYFKEMAANYSYSTVELFSWFLGKVFHSIFEGLTLRPEDFEKLRKASKEGPLVFVPTHKSYVDFLMLSYLMHEQQIAPPHIIAGINLNFWPFGALAKRGGAIFIRRSFRGNILYQEILKRYVTSLLAHKINLEFFMEGARSRNGKLAPPKFGILKMITDAYIKGELTEKVRFVPVSIIYDRVTEDRMHRRELEGGDKVPESFTGLFRAMRVLFRNFGKVHVRIADPVAIEDWARTEIADSSGSSALIRLAVQKLAFDIAQRINSVSPVTSIGVVCAALLGKPEASWTRAEFETYLIKLEADFKAKNVLISPELEANFVKACRRAIARLLEDKLVEKYQAPSGGLGYQVVNKQRLGIFYYKNSAIHSLLDFAIAGICSIRGAPVMEEIFEIRAYLQFEFFFQEKESFAKGVLNLSRERDCRPYAFLLDSYLETIHTGLNQLIAMQELILSKKEWQNRLFKRSRALLNDGDILNAESVNTQAYGALIELALNRQWLRPTQAEQDLLKPAPLNELKKHQAALARFRGRIQNWTDLDTSSFKDSDDSSLETAQLPPPKA